MNENTFCTTNDLKPLANGIYYCSIEGLFYKKLMGQNYKPIKITKAIKRDFVYNIMQLNKKYTGKSLNLYELLKLEIKDLITLKEKLINKGFNKEAV